MSRRSEAPMKLRSEGDSYQRLCRSHEQQMRLGSL
jgi:hypothetical protein